MYCSKCGIKLSDDARFCKKCGYNVDGENSSEQSLKVSGNGVDTVSENHVADSFSKKAPSDLAYFFAVIPIISWGLLLQTCSFDTALIIMFIIYITLFVLDVRALKKHDDIYGTRYYGAWCCWGLVASLIYLIIRGCKTGNHKPTIALFVAIVVLIFIIM